MRRKWDLDDLQRWAMKAPPDRFFIWISKKLLNFEKIQEISEIQEDGRNHLIRTMQSALGIAPLSFDETTVGVQERVQGIADLSPTDRKVRIREACAIARKFVRTGFFHRRHTLRGIKIWECIPIEFLDEVLQEIASVHYEERIYGLAVLLPALSKFRPDLLPDFGEVLNMVERSPEAALLLVYSSYYLPQHKQATLIERALEMATNLNENQEHICGLILEDAVHFVPDSELHFIASCLATYRRGESIPESYFKALKLFLARIDANMELFEKVWPLFNAVSTHWYNQLVEVVALHLTREYVAELMLLTLDFDESDKLSAAYFALRDRWLELPLQDAYLVWCRVIRALGSRPRAKLLDHFVWLSPIVKRLGGARAIVDIGDYIFETDEWRWSQEVEP
jgi:hypothetical protein